MSAVRDSGGRFTSAPRVGALYRVVKADSSRNGHIARVLPGATRNGYVNVITFASLDAPRETWKRGQYRADDLTAL